MEKKDITFENLADRAATAIAELLLTALEEDVKSDAAARDLRTVVNELRQENVKLRNTIAKQKAALEKAQALCRKAFGQMGDAAATMMLSTTTFTTELARLTDAMGQTATELDKVLPAPKKD